MRIDPTGVTRTGEDLLAETAEAKDRIRVLLESTVTAVDGHSGWAASGALDRCRTAWRAKLNGLVDRTRRTAEDLIDAASAATGTDNEAAGRLRGVIDEMAGP
jgi:hypothetical protein